MRLSPYLSFDGRCAEALAFYEQALGAKVVMKLPYGGSPMEGHVGADWSDKLMHARFTVGDQQVMASDVMPGRYEAPKGTQVHINIEIPDEHEADRVFATLAEGGTVEMPIQETFWAKRFGVVSDKFGTKWMVDCEKQPG